MKQAWIAGTRRSALATTQTGHVLSALGEQFPAASITTHEIVTQGDRIQSVALSKVGGKGLFISEIEDALLAGTVDFAVHSMKDVPAELAPGLQIGAVPRREDPRDLLISKAGYTLETLPAGARIGTSSLRRSAQIKWRRPDVQIETLRGNIDTRLRKAETLDAIVLAAAGLIRMGWWDESAGMRADIPLYGVALSVDEMIPAVGQGALALEIRTADPEALALTSVLHDPVTAHCVALEREFLKVVGGSCQVPVAGFAHQEEFGTYVLHGLIGLPDGSRVVREVLKGPASASLGVTLGQRLLAAGGREILRQVGTESP